MPAARIALYIIGGLVVLGVVYGISRAAQAWQVSAAVSRCAELQAARARMSVAGADPNDLARIDAEIRTCQQTASSLGATVDLSASTLNGCLSKANSRRSQVNDMVGTDYADSVKRNNQRNNINRLGLEMVQCFQGAIDDAETDRGLLNIKAAITREIAYSLELASHYGDRDRGYDRACDACEPEGKDKAGAELTNVYEPLRLLLPEVNAKRDEIAERKRMDQQRAAA